MHPDEPLHAVLGDFDNDGNVDILHVYTTGYPGYNISIFVASRDGRSGFDSVWDSTFSEEGPAAKDGFLRNAEEGNDIVKEIFQSVSMGTWLLVLSILLFESPLPAGWEQIPLPSHNIALSVSTIVGEAGRDTIYVSTGSDWGGTGGVWMSTDDGVGWTCISSGGIPRTELVTRVRVNEANHAQIAAGGWHRGVYLTGDGGSSWTYTAPPGNNSIVEALLARTSPSPLLLSGYGNGWFYRTTDYGQSWEAVIESSPSRDVVENPFEGGKLYAAVHDEVYGSTDDGETWDSLSTLEGVADLAVDPDAPHHLYAAAQGVARSSDGGTSWEVVGLDSFALSAVALPGDSLVLAGGEECGLMRSTDQGLSWEETDARFRSVKIREIVPEKGDPRRLWVASRYLDLLRSEDSGALWKEVPIGTDRIVPLCMVLSLKNPRALHVSSFSKIAVTRDLGVEWETLSGGMHSYWSLAISPLDSLVLLRGWDTGLEGAVLELSQDGGRSWETVLTDYFASVFDVSFHPLRPDTAFVSFYTHYRSTDGGRNWDYFPVAEDFYGGWYIFDPYDPDIIFIYGGLGNAGSIYRSRNGSLTWERMDSGLPGGAEVSAMTPAPSVPGRYYLALGDSSGSVYVSTDQGDSWRKTGEVGTQNAPVRFLLSHPDDRNLVYLLCKGGAFLSRDGGGNWEEDNEGIAQVEDLYTMAVDSTAGGKLFILGHSLYFTEGWLYQRDLEEVSIEGPERKGNESRFPFSLFQNYPNPCNPLTTIEFEIPGEGPQKVSLDIYDSRGRLVRKLLESTLEPGRHRIAWDAINERGEMVSSGVYFSRLVVKDRVLTRKIALVK